MDLALNESHMLGKAIRLAQKSHRNDQGFGGVGTRQPTNNKPRSCQVIEIRLLAVVESALATGTKYTRDSIHRNPCIERDGRYLRNHHRDATATSTSQVTVTPTSTKTIFQHLPSLKAREASGATAIWAGRTCWNAVMASFCRRLTGRIIPGAGNTVCQLSAYASNT